MASTPIRTGSAGGAVALPSRIDYDPRTGRREVYSFTCPRDQALTQEATLQAAGVAYSRSPDGVSPNDIFEYYKTTDEAGNDASTKDEISTPVWSFAPVQLSQSIWKNRFVQAEFDKLKSIDDTNKAGGFTTASALLRLHIEAFVQGRSTIANPDDAEAEEILVSMPVINALVSGWGLDPLVIYSLIDALARGQDSELYSTWSFAKRSKVGSDAEFKLSVSGLNAMYTMGRFNSEENPPSSIKIQLPTNGFMHKQDVQGDQEADGSWTISQRWVWTPNFSALSYEVLS